MSKLPKTVWWVGTQTPGGIRALCIEASSPSRIRAFLARYPSQITHLERTLGVGWDGKPLSEDALRRLVRGIYRQMKAQGADQEARQDAIQAKVDCILACVAHHHGLPVDDLRDTNVRNLPTTRARGHAVHVLKDYLGASQPEITRIMNFANHSAVRYWLGIPVEKVQTPLREEQWQERRKSQARAR